VSTHDGGGESEPICSRGVYTHDGGERSEGDLKEDCRKRDAERHYKRKKLRGISLEKMGYDQARALGPALILEKLSSAGETEEGRPEKHPALSNKK